MAILAGMSAPPPTPLLIEQTKPLILVGNGDYDTAMLARFAPMGPVVAVDGGYYGCRIAGITPDLLIGDMDSVDAEDLIDARRKTSVHPLAEQDTTDLEKALHHIRAPAIIGFGFLGKRFDHSLAALSVLAKYTRQHKVMLVGSDDVLHVTSQPFSMQMDRGRRVSIWPLGQVDFARSTGLHWPLDGLRMAPGGQVGTSNKMSADRMEITPAEGQQAAYAVIAETIYLQAMLAALMDQSIVPEAPEVP